MARASGKEETQRRPRRGLRREDSGDRRVRDHRSRLKAKGCHHVNGIQDKSGLLRMSSQSVFNSGLVHFPLLGNLARKSGGKGAGLIGHRPVADPFDRSAPVSARPITGAQEEMHRLLRCNFTVCRWLDVGLCRHGWALWSDSSRSPTNLGVKIRGWQDIACHVQTSTVSMAPLPPQPLLSLSMNSGGRGADRDEIEEGNQAASWPELYTTETRLVSPPWSLSLVCTLA